MTWSFHVRLGFGALLLMGGLNACASADIDRSLARTNQEAESFTNGSLALARHAEEREALARKADALLAQPLSAPAAVQLALVNSPSFQALLAGHWAQAAEAAQSGRLANPVFTYERIRLLDELEIGRMLSVSLVDLLTFPWRQDAARARLEAVEVRLTRDVVREVTEVRRAWVQAVAAQERLGYARQVFETAEVSAELARRMQAAGNFTTVQRVRQQSFYADAASQLAFARHAATAGREALVRRLGLGASQVSRLKLPERLPDPPPEPRAPETVGDAARAGNLDVRLAEAELQAAAEAQGLGRVTSLLDVEGGLRRDTAEEGDERDTTWGWELAVALPVFDWGDMQRAGLNARTLEAGYALEASLRGAESRLREAYSAYRTAWDIARHYREEVIPLAQVLAEENVLRYNAMLIGVFELLADAREQIRAVMAGIDAGERFWLAEAALEAAIMGTAAGQSPAEGPAPLGEVTDADH